MTSTWAVVLAAGSGSRYGGPKHYEQLGDRRVVDWSLDAARAACDGVVLVVAVDDPRVDLHADAVVEGGATRSSSVRAGLAAVPRDCDVVIVHDAARPGASPALFGRVAAAVRAGADAAVPGIVVVDTIKRVAVEEGRPGWAVVIETVPREELVAVQTPQAFARAALQRAHATDNDASDDAGLVEAWGGTVLAVEGEAAAHKITTRVDLGLVALLMGLEP